MKREQLEQELGKRLRKHRERLGISQSYLADILNRDQTSVSKMEQGVRQVGAVELLLWSRALNLDHTELAELISIGPYAK